MHAPFRASAIRLVSSASMLSAVVACAGTTTISSADAPSDTTMPAALPTELSFKSVLAKPPMLDTARVTGGAGSVAVVGLLNQTAPCFDLSSQATRTGPHVVVRMTSKETSGTCATFAAGAFDYDVGVKGLAAGSYGIDVLHRVQFKDGSVVEKKVGGSRVEVR